MTDNEIIKAFQYCFTNDFGKTNCYKCAFYTATAKCMDDMQNAVIDLINRQKAEIERLKGSVITNNIMETQRIKREAKFEAIKECLDEKVKNYVKAHCNPYGKPDFDYDTSLKILNFIDNLVKEMAEVNENDRA